MHARHLILVCTIPRSVCSEVHRRFAVPCCAVLCNIVKLQPLSSRRFVLVAIGTHVILKCSVGSVGKSQIWQSSPTFTSCLLRLLDPDFSRNMKRRAANVKVTKRAAPQSSNSNANNAGAGNSTTRGGGGGGGEENDSSQDQEFMGVVSLVQVERHYGFIEVCKNGYLSTAHAVAIKLMR